MNVEDLAIERLREAVLLQAVRDYKEALNNCDTYMEGQLFRFFLSEWGQLLSADNGEKIITMCAEQVGVETNPGQFVRRDWL